MVIVVGTGAGGAIIAMKLAKANIPVTIIERGPYIASKDAYETYDMKYYDKRFESEQSLDLLKTTCVGGSTIVAAGNGVRVLEEEFKDLGIDLSKEYETIEELIGVHQMDDDHIGEGTRLFLESAKECGFDAIKMPKFIRDEDCKPCGKCSFGCPRDAKWSGKDFIDIAIENGAELIENAEVTKILTAHKSASGVEYIQDGQVKTIESDLVILAAGAIDTAVILQKTGIDAGNKLFFDPFISVGGVLKDIKYNTEVQMNGLAIGNEYILAPHFSSFISKYIKETYPEVEDKDILSIMVKVQDDMVGSVDIDGNVKKFNTIGDIRRLGQGAAAAGSILQKAGVDATTMTSTVFRGAHPGGTAAIGEVVDKNLKTEIDGLYLGDASVIPISPGKPPILLILALAERLANHLIEEVI
ncbi:GMC oxidoreductase family protein [Methanobrevibacter ruminantium M1]|uniref:GMC oxidoreductase family protein n=1 Tax=Methanobrevibacter ruminantium (strain ATCC 35063 / DSM 1093 / JCM 13430 / OCM 146 / M1) TaxID=634498 RepID=D3DZ23_METRM|nr:GMC family oxidoreductase [Methanobrevibacter ruminantium]ADC47573.1 GMC oxidoreductase family protein [Methanobrevibacter ruminantium M1]